MMLSTDELRAVLPRDIEPDELEEIELDEYGQALALPGWQCSDGDVIKRIYARTAVAAARKYVARGDYGFGGSVTIAVWREAVVMGDDGPKLVTYDEDDVVVDIEPDHEVLIRDAAGHRDVCGSDPDDHDWTSDGEGGCDSNPGVWATGGTSMMYAEHCRVCGLHRTICDPGRQRNPGEGIEYEYRMLSADEIAEMRRVGAMEE